MMFHLLDIVIRSPLLKNLLMALYQPREQLILTFLLFLVLQYVFTLIAFVWLSDEYPDFACNDSLFRCLLINVDQTFKNDGGIANYLRPSYNYEFDITPDHLNDTYVDQHPTGNGHVAYYFNSRRILFDNMFNLIIVILIIQIVAGIIIDTFTSLRQKQEAIE